MSQTGLCSPVVADDRLVFEIGLTAEPTSADFRLCSLVLISVLIPIFDPEAW
jgi:hypothetical protein